MQIEQARPSEAATVAAVLSEAAQWIAGEGRPLCCELWPGHTADVTTLIPIVDRLRQRFHLTSTLREAFPQMLDATN